MLSAAGPPSLITARGNGATLLVSAAWPHGNGSWGLIRELPALQTGIGRPVTAVDGIVDSYNDAHLAVRTLRRVAQDQRLMAYEDFDFATRLFADVGPERMMAWAEDFLNPLVNRDNLLAGLRAYFENDQNISDRPATELVPGQSLTGALRRVPLSPVDSSGRARGGSVIGALNARPPQAITPALTGIQPRAPSQAPQRGGSTSDHRCSHPLVKQRLGSLELGIPMVTHTCRRAQYLGIRSSQNDRSPW
ncbi:hypothetical protein ACFYXF_47600 [Streptomyces sp. NPDC002680]|uniref:hypothetical protein n=1 Tax=Streptomyces sp. NPDC002680 TaxID=3364659 RepID=UPI0036CA3394